MTVTAGAEWAAQRSVMARDAMPAMYRECLVERPEITTWADALLVGDRANLLLRGPKGTGKTGNAWAAWPYLLGQGWVGRFRAVTEIRLLDEQINDRPAVESYSVAPLLLIDDLGGASLSDWGRSVVFSLIDTRWLAQRPTIFTTNLTDKALEQHLGDRATSRIADRVTTVTFTGRDRRLT